MRVTNVLAATLIGCVSISAFADATCEAKAKTRDDFLACTRIDTDRALSGATRLYQAIRPLTKREKQVALDRNFNIWQSRLKSDCDVLGKAFNDWGDDYSPDTDFQIAECRLKISAQELEFYSWLACPDDIETSDKPKCAALTEALGKRK
ncbi:hypothetical protein QF000_003556 [Paraburkholderia atlantica]|uniref:hypothetical protein n=1 Tax=Paraburkholderia atlantica TaxID=2654982 RepID=UPI003D1FA43A